MMLLPRSGRGTSHAHSLSFPSRPRSTPHQTRSMQKNAHQLLVKTANLKKKICGFMNIEYCLNLSHAPCIKKGRNRGKKIS